MLALFRYILVICLIPLCLILSHPKANIQASACPEFIHPSQRNQYHEKQLLFPIHQNKKWGFINREGQIIVQPKFDEVRYFLNRAAAVKTDNKWGFINPSGRFIVQPKFDDVHSFQEGRSAVKLGKLWGIIDGSGAFVMKPKFDYISAPLEGRSVVHQGNQRSFIDLDGKLITKDVFFDVGNFSEGMAVFLGRNGNKNERGFIDRSGRVVISLQGIYPDIESSGFNAGLAPIYLRNSFAKYDSSDSSLGGKKLWGFIDKSGQIKISPKYNSVSDFSECIASVMLQDKVGAINTLGQLVIEPKFDFIERFSNGLAVVGKGEFLPPPLLDTKNSSPKFGYVGKDGKLVIEPKFYSAHRFSEGLAAVQIEPDGKLGYIDRNGVIQIQPQFSSAGFFRNGLARVDTPNTWGYIDSTGRYVWSTTK